MKNKLPESFPTSKKEELNKIVEIIKKNTRVEMIILYGSYARGDFVEKEEINEKTKSVFKSDFDLFVVTRSKDWQEKARGWTLKAGKEFEDAGIKTVVQFAVDNIQFTNKMLKVGQYFHKDVYKEGILLFDSGEYKLNKPREYSELDPEERLEQAEKGYEKYMKNVEIELKNFEFNFKEGESDSDYLNKAAFELHQATENLLHCVGLVFEGYKPPSHNLLELKEKNQKHIPQLKGFFFDEGKACDCSQKRTPAIYKSQRGLENICVDCNEEALIFMLLATAYVDARYKDDYEVSKDALSKMKGKVVELKALVEKRCKAEIGGMR